MKFTPVRPESKGASLSKLALLISSTLLVLTGCPIDSDDSEGFVSIGDPVQIEAPTVKEAYIDNLVTQIGGSTSDVVAYSDGVSDWTLYNMANRFAAAPTTTTKGTVTEMRVPGYIQKITLLEGYGGKNYALLSMGSKGIGVVDITSPGSMSYVRTMTVDYMTPEYTISEGGGGIILVPASTEPHASGPVNDVLVDDKGTPEDTSDDELFIANGAFGIQTTQLSNLMDAEADGTLTIDGNEVWTLKYAGEVPWGGPLSLQMHNGNIYAALGFLGISIFDPSDLTALGNYNLYTDCDNNAQEDWFGYPKRKISCPDQSNPDLVLAPPLEGVDPVDADGMPTYVQASYELKQKSDLTWYPWAEFDRFGKYYYNARDIELVDLPASGMHPARTVAYIAYSLGGLIAVDVSDPAAPAYEGYIPAVPSHGPDEPPINVDKRGILSHSGSGRLKEAGVIGVRVETDPTNPDAFRVYYTDHFGGLIVAKGADSPQTNWNNGGNFNNDTDARVFWPDYEFVQSYDMTPVVVGDEAIPAFLVADSNGNYTDPVMLATGEISGHAGALFLTGSGDYGNPGQVDVVQSSGAGGVSFVDFIDLTSANVVAQNRYGVPVTLASTNEIGANVDGTPGQSISIGHTEGVTVAGDFLYIADGPHGATVWKIADGQTAIDDIHLVANTLQSEYPITGYDVAPTPHAFKVAFSDDANQAYVLSQSLGIRRVDVSAVNNGTAAVGAPALLNAFGNTFEHSTEANGDLDTLKVIGQDHAYGVAFSGKYAIVADGDNGLTVYDTTADPATGTHLVANIGDSDDTSSGRPKLGRSSTVKLWTSDTGNTFAVVAAGAYGISVVDMTAFLASGEASDLTLNKLVKTFEPIKAEEDNLFGSADGKSVDVHIINDVAYFSYDSFGLVAYNMEDLIRPATEERPEVVPEGQDPEICATIVDVTKLSDKQGGVGECRPVAVGHFKLQQQAGYEDVEGGALYMTPQFFPTQYYDATGNLVTTFEPRLLFYVAYGDAGVLKIDWRDPANPTMLGLKEVVGGAVGTAINNARVYVASSSAGLNVLN